MKINEYISVQEAASRRDLSVRQVQIICKSGKIPGVVHFGKSYAIPADAVKPTRTGKTKPGPRKAPEEL
ncbi:MAG: DNA-binding protein [Clostridiales bacterium]|nr:DNA-binding protein [Clostridiales bacterium]